MSAPRPLGAEAREASAGGPEASPAIRSAPILQGLDADEGLAALVEAIDEILPQTQCRRCGFEGCRPYAEALARGRTELNRCPPGGDAGVLRLAALLNRPLLPIDPTCGRADAPRLIARIIEADCIGCTMCIQACPVDAIMGAPKRMHTVIAELCTGCELCVSPCPVDCIALEPVAASTPWRIEEAAAARRRHQARAVRLARRGLERAQHRIDEAQEKLEELDHQAVSGPATGAPNDEAAETRKRAIIEAAIRRARERLAASAPAERNKHP